jgi:hypothetical protein
MKKYFLVLTLFSSFLLAHDASNYSYLQMGMMGVPNDSAVYISPLLSAGYRMESESGILDVGGQFSYASFHGSDYLKESFQLTFPKVAYLKTFPMNENSQVYCGGGVGFGYLMRKVKESREHKIHDFAGFIGDLCLGYQLPFKSGHPQAIQLDYEFPMLAANRAGVGPLSVLQLSYIVGF